MELVRKIWAFLLDSVQTFLIAAAIFLVIYVFLFRPFEVKGESMFPTLHNNEYVLTNLIVLRFGNPQFGDVVVFESPTEPEKDFIKRVMGVPGDQVMVKNGDIYRNGKILDQSDFLEPTVTTHGGAFMKEGIEVTVPEESYLVIGDNRDYSSDSREWGFVKKTGIIGKAFFVYWPLGELKPIMNPYN